MVDYNQIAEEALRYRPPAAAELAAQVRGRTLLLCLELEALSAVALLHQGGKESVRPHILTDGFCMQRKAALVMVEWNRFSPSVVTVRAGGEQRELSADSEPAEMQTQAREEIAQAVRWLFAVAP